MDFKNRAIIEKSTTTSSSLSSIIGVSEQIPSGDGVASGMFNTFQMPMEMEMWRALEKEKIRREIITGEIVRRKALEDEVMREMLMERQLRFPMQMCLVKPFLFQDQLHSQSNLMNNPMQVNDVIDMSQQKLSKTVDHVEIEPSSKKIDKDEINMLPRANLDVVRAKRKAVEISTNDKDEEWRCSICQVNTTSELSLYEHKQGKKHKNKAMTTTHHMIGLDARTLMEIPNPSITKGEFHQTMEKKTMVQPRILEERKLVKEEEVEEGEIIGGAETEVATEMCWEK